MSRSLIHSIKRTLSVIPTKDWKIIFFISVFQFFLAVFDLVGVFLVGIISLILISGAKPQGTLESINFVSDWLSNYGLTNSQIVLVLGISASSLFIIKTTISIFTTRKILHYLNNIGSRLSILTIERTIRTPYLTINKLSVQEIIFNTTRGIELLISNVLAPAIILIADFATVILLVLGLLSIDFLAAFSSFLFFGGIAILLYRATHSQINSLGTLNTKLTMETNEVVAEVFLNYKENLVASRFQSYLDSLGKLRRDLGGVLSEVTFVQYLAKYIFELTLAVLLSLLAVSQYLFSSKPSVLPIIAIFLASAMRLAPSILRVQQGVTQIYGSFAMAETAISYIEKLGHFQGIGEKMESVDNQNVQPIKIEFKAVDFQYPDTQKPALFGINLLFEPGRRVVIVGPSGSGKTTLTDLMLGILQPDSGIIELNGVPPKEFLSKNRGVIGYVPQEIVLARKSIIENVCIGYDMNVATIERFEEVVKITGLSEFINQFPKGKDTILDSRLTNLSGGQKQRIGLARALFSKPKLVILDEATSALDYSSESEITDALDNLKQEVTVVLITHSINSVIGADSVIYIENGSIRVNGSIDQLRNEIPEFNSQFLMLEGK